MLTPRSDQKSMHDNSMIQGEAQEVYLETHEDIQVMLEEKDNQILQLLEKLKVYESTDSSMVQFNQKSKEAYANLKKMMQKKSEEFNKKTEEQKSELANKNKQISDLEQFINDLRGQIDRFHIQMDLKDQLIRSLEVQQKQKVDKVHELETLISQHRNLKSTLEGMQQYKQLSLLDHIDSLKSLNQQIKESFFEVSDFMNDIVARLQQIDPHTQNANQIKQQIQEINLMIQQQSEELVNKQQQEKEQLKIYENQMIIELKQQKIEQETKVQQLQEHIQELKNEMFNKDEKLLMLQKQSQRLEDDKDTLKQMLNKINNEVKEFNEKYNLLLGDFEKLKKENNQLRRQQVSILNLDKEINLTNQNPVSSKDNDLFTNSFIGQNQQQLQSANAKSYQTPPTKDLLRIPKGNQNPYQDSSILKPIKVNSNDKQQKIGQQTQQFQLEYNESDKQIRDQLNKDMAVFNIMLFSITFIITILVLLNTFNEAQSLPGLNLITRLFGIKTTTNSVIFDN
ncbi:UNKNOWN [Stylonychia lemnae]|uniref:Transmembrane protein n=1 Tax=Stylonychia lemnae TaxID=5949 RepID=A0A078A693_STYLE|nr:UNKNOWN [Stylonychia lemnae]|eukprot:CDW77095.1 UNKNOWN [Stylonychia lemnae]